MWRTEVMNVSVASKTKRLYGEDVDPRDWAHMDYKLVLEVKIMLASKRITELTEVDMMERDTNNIQECMKSIKLCREMVKELGM